MNRRQLLVTSASLGVLALAPTAVQASPAARLKTWSLETPVLTLPEMAQALVEAGESDRAAYVESMAASGDLMEVLPWMQVQGGAYAYAQAGLMPGMAFEGAPTRNSDGVVNPALEPLRIACGDVDLDAALVRENGPALWRLQSRMDAKARGLRLTRQFINGDSRQGAGEPMGLRNRIIGPMHKDLGGSALALEVVDEMIGAVQDPTHMILSKRMRNLMSASARSAESSTFIEWGVDEYGRRTAYYLPRSGPAAGRRLRMVVTDYDEANTQIIDFNEDDRESTSIYVVALGNVGVCGLCHDMPQYDDFGPVKANAEGVHVKASLEDADLIRARVEWLAAPGVMSGRSAARISGIVKAVVAV